MYDELETALSDIIPDEQLYIYLDAYLCLQEIGFEQQDTELQTILGLQDGIADTDLLTGRINACLTTALIEALNEFGIVLSPEAGIKHHADALFTVARFEAYVIPEDLVDLLNAEGDNEEIFSSIVPLFTDQTEQAMLDYLESVSDATLTRMRQVATENSPADNAYPDKPDGYHKRISLINQSAKEVDWPAPELVLSLAANGVRCGTNLAAMRAALTEDLNACNTAELSVELLALIVFSDTELKDVAKVYVECIREYSDELNEQYRLHQAAKEQWTHYGHLIDDSGRKFPDLFEV